MQRVLLFFGLLLTTSMLSAQCSDLFISEYVEGYANNKALEIYNPTGSAINLSNYSLVRFSNGSTTAPSEKILPLPDVMLESYDVYVIVIDKQNMDLWDSQLDKPVWNGYNLIDTLFDFVTGEPELDENDNVIFGPQYNDNGSAIFGDDYDENYDLQCKADIFLCPVYDVNNTMYFNGNDAVALITGSEVAPDGSNLIDVIGVIGEDPENTIDEPAWVNADGFWLTRDRTLIRKPEIAAGRNAFEDVIFQSGGTFQGEEWISTFKNSFEYLGVHTSDCDDNALGDVFSCSTGVFTTQVNVIPFSMFPNPAEGFVVVEAPEAIQRIEISNLMGQVLRSETAGLNTERAEINLGDLSGGMYLVKLHFAGNQLSIQKLVIEK